MESGDACDLSWATLSGEGALGAFGREQMREPYLRRGACLWDAGIHLLKNYREIIAKFAADSPPVIQEWILARILFYSLGLPI